jgi:triosephosphate isomerase
MRKSWVIGNWKMNGSLVENERLVRDLLNHASFSNRVALCVPFPYLSQVANLVHGSGLILAAQNVNSHSSGAYTGEVSVSMLKEMGVEMVLVGHSERRQMFGESDLSVAEKAGALVESGLTPIVCLGETLDERESDLAKQVVLSQLAAVSAHLGAAGLAKCVLAYEPVWAIGTGRVATAPQVQEVHAWLRRALAEIDEVLAQKISILYGGSVKPVNAMELFGCVDVDGGLIGGAALNSADFVAICQTPCKQ